MIPFAVLTQSTTPIIGWIARFFGIIMNALYNGLARIGIENIGLCIILFTVIINVILLPLTIRQQKSTKITNFIQPEVKKIQSKYRGKNDTASQQAMNDEVQAVYDKYGVSMTSGCLPLIIQLPILYGLYAVIRNVPAYVGAVKEVFMNIVTAITAQPEFTSKFATVIDGMRGFSIDSYTGIAGTAAGNNWLVDVLASFSTQWDALKSAFPAASDVITANLDKINHFNSFLGLNLTATPSQKILSAMILIPILSAVTQFLSIKLTQVTSQQPQQQQDQVGAGMMKGMNYTMPIFSLIICFMLPIGIGIYWIASAVVRTIFIMIINRSMKDVDPAALIEANKEKAEEKRKKRADRQMSATQRAAQASAAAQYGATKRERINAGFQRVAELDKVEDGADALSGQTMANYSGRSVYDYEEEFASQALEDPNAEKKRQRALKRGESSMSMAARVHMVQDYNTAHGESSGTTDGGYRRKRKKK